jgi:hypothetical protein
MSLRRVFSLATLVLFVLALPLAAGTAKGTLTVNGKTTKLSHVYATTKPNPFDKTRTDVVVVLTDTELPAEAIHDTFEMMEAVDKLKFSGISVEITDEKDVVSGMIYSPNFKKDMSQVSVTGVQKLDLKDFSTSHVAGRVFMDGPNDFFENVYEFEATFDVATTAKPKPAPLKGTPLPAGGGEPGKAYEAYRKVMAKGDIPALRKAVAEERAKEMDSPEFKEMFELIQSMQPKSVTITGGAIDGDTATLLVTSKDQGENSNGTVTLVKEKGAWKLYKESWKTVSE